MRIACFTDTFYPEVNGVAHTLQKLADYWNDNGIEHIFFAPDYEDNTQDDINSPVIRIKGIRPSIYPQSRVCVPSYLIEKEHIDNFAPDLIHITTELGIGLLGLRYARKHHIPVVMSYHTNFDQYLKFYKIESFEPLLTKYMLWFHSFAKVNLCPSKQTLLELQEKGFQNLDIWSRGVDTNSFSPTFRNEETRRELCADPSKKLFLYTGRISAEKGLDVLLESIKAVNKQYTNTHFVFTGDGPFLETIKSSGIENITLTGMQHGEALSRIYASCDAFVFPSGTETFGNVVLEAMASGLPVVCVNSGGVLDFAENGKNALICTFRDEPSLTEAILRFLNDPAYAKSLAAGALQTAERRNWRGVFNRLTASYTAVLSKSLVAAS
jgi:Glycosyltransferase